MTEIVVDVDRALIADLTVTAAIATVEVTAGIGGPQGAPGVTSIPMTIRGVLASSIGIIPLPMAENKTIVEVLAAVATAPTGADIVFDVKVNGSSIFTVLFPTIVAGTKVSVPIPPAFAALVAGDVITVDILQVGTAIPGAYATVVLVVE